MSAQVWRRRRNAFLVFGAVTAGGYVSYRVYKSHYVSRKTKQISGFLQNFNRLSGALGDATDCAAILLGDFKTFLLSDEEEVPQSVKQVFKVLKCREFQEGLVSLSHSILLGKIGGLQRQISSANASSVISNDREINKPSGNDLVDKSIDDSEGVYEQRQGSKDGLLDRFMDKLFSERGNGFASALVGCAARNLVLAAVEAMTRNQRIQNKGDSTSLVSDIFEVQQVDEEKKIDNFRSTRNSDKSMPVGTSKSALVDLDSVLDIVCDKRGRLLISECIETFVATAVSVYLVKTRDINVCEELVAGLTKHQAGVKDLLRCVSSGAVETLVRTSHEVLSEGYCYPNKRSDVCKKGHEKRWQVFPENPARASMELDQINSSNEGDIPISQAGNTIPFHKVDKPNVTSINCLSEYVNNMESQKALNSIYRSTSIGSGSGKNQDKGGRYLAPPYQTSEIAVSGQGGSLNVMPFSLIDGLSKALAVPNNRKLIIDVAGAMTSEAVHSFFDAICNIIKPIYGGQNKSQEQAGTPSLQARYVTKKLALNSLVVGTLWLAVVMHVTSGVLNPI